MITLITPTGDRPEAFSLCEYWMSRQTCSEPIQWIVVDDGQQPTCCTRGQEYMRREPQRTDSRHTLSLNLAAALPHVRGEKILIIEDDDYYAPCYLETMCNWLADGELAGEVGAKYYYLQDRAWYHHTNHMHASLCRTGFRASLLPTLRDLLSHMESGDWKIDMRLWHMWKGSRKLVPSVPHGPAMCVGIKQMPGRTGVTWPIRREATTDPGLQKLQEWTQRDWLCYRRFLCEQKSGIDVLYTAVFGGYDEIAKAPEDIRCVAITDGQCRIGEGWEKRLPPKNLPSGLSTKNANRWCKMHPHLLFPGKSTLYVDGNVRFKTHPGDITSLLRSRGGSADVLMFRHGTHSTIEEEADTIIRIGYGSRERVFTEIVRANLRLPVGWGGLLVRHDNAMARVFNELWWNLYQGHDRDQIVLPIALQQSGVNWAMIDEPTPFFGQVSQLIEVSRHRYSW